MIEEHALVILTRHLPHEGLEAGDVGTVVMAHPGRDDLPPGYTLEFTTPAGEPVAVIDAPADAVRPVAEGDIRCVRLRPHGYRPHPTR